MLLAALFVAAAGWRASHGCHPSLQAAERIAEYLEGSGEGSGEGNGQEGSGEYTWLEMMITGEDDCVLLHYDCPTGEVRVEPIQEMPGVWACGASSDYLLRVGKGSGPYDVVFCRAGAWTVPSGVTLDDVIADTPNFNCQRMQPNAI